VESAQGELGARFADRLSGDDADRLAHLGHAAARQVFAVAFGTDAKAALMAGNQSVANVTASSIMAGSTFPLALNER